MAVKDDGLHYPTETIISNKARKHYRIPVRSQHWQLRSLISAEKRHLVYFPGGNGSNHVQRLNTQTRECETIKLLTFAPRCLVAKDGWLCCGSEHGEFVALRIHEEAGSDLDISLSPDADGRLPFGLTSLGDDSITSLLLQARRQNKSMLATNVKLAKDRVNCITLWLPPTRISVHECAYNIPVAVLANNDRTVTLVSLDSSADNEKTEALDTISYPDYVNRALISPDGHLLIAILDDPYLYVHERVERDSQSATLGHREERDCCWELRQRLLLKSQRKDDRSDSRGSFAACFSASGAYLAVGTQHGTISIFDASLLTDPDADPLITTFTSSRPESGPGAIRDMAFCPGPFDILGWTEDRGHVGIADIRSNYVIRQIIDINDEADFEHINILDRNTVDPRLLERRADRREADSPLGTNLNRASDLQESRRQGLEGIESLNHPLTANETLVLEAIQGDRRRREQGYTERHFARRRGALEPTLSLRGTLVSVNRDGATVLRPGLHTGERPIHRPSQNAADSSRTQPRTSSGNGRTIGDLLGSYREQRSRMTERDTQTHTNARRPEQRWMERLGETVAAIRETTERQNERQDDSYLSVLEILQTREAGANDGEEEDSSLLLPLVNQAVTRWEENALRGPLAPDHGVFEVPPSPDNTAGLSWSEDGRTLFIGAQNGIYELQVNVQSRKLFPSICPY